jgi:hypothetical protein
MIVTVLALLCAGSAQAAYELGYGGEATPSVLAAGGGTDYSVGVTGKLATVDIVLVLDNSTSMNNDFGFTSRWSAVQAASNAFLSRLQSEGFFTRGGKLGVVLFSTTATTAVAPTSDVAAIQAGIAAGAPGGSSCVSCGLKQASDLLAAIPSPSSHRRIAYVIADGGNSVEPPSVAEALSAANAAGVERRVIGISINAQLEGLEAISSSGTVAYPESTQQLTEAYEAAPTRLPGATGLSWTFHLAPGFTPSAPTASLGSATVSGGDVTWTIPALGAESATLTFHAAHDAGSGCSATSLLSGTTFSDTEGDAAPAVGLGPISISGCAPSGGGGSLGGAPTSGPPSTTTPSTGTPVPSAPKPTPAAAVIVLPKPAAICSAHRGLRIAFKPPKGTKIKVATVKVGGGKKQAYPGSRTGSGIAIKEVPTGKFKVTVTAKLSDGRSLTLSQAYKPC